MTNNKNLGVTAGIAGATTGAGLGTMGVIGALSSISATTPAALVPYAAVQVGASTLGISSALGGAAATSTAVAAIGGPAVVAVATVCAPALMVGGLCYGLYSLFSD